MAPEFQSADHLPLIDTHCHLDFDELRPQLANIIARAGAAGIGGFIVPGVDPDHWERLRHVAACCPGAFPAFGIHPMHSDRVDDAVLSRLEAIAGCGVAIGEIGLDPRYKVPLEIQERALRRQVRLAVRRGMPVLIHCRQVFQRTLEVLREEKAGQVGGLMHAFSGSPEMAREFMRLGFAISLCGTVTWPTAVRPVRLAREIPLEHLVLETDAPDLAPHPYQGGRNEPALLVEIAKAVAALRGITVDEVAHATRDTALRIFGPLFRE